MNIITLSHLAMVGRRSLPTPLGFAELRYSSVPNWGSGTLPSNLLKQENVEIAVEMEECEVEK